MPAILIWGCAAGPAVAHVSGVAQPEALWRAWSFDPLVLVPLLLAVMLYARGVRALWSRAGRGRGITRVRVLSFSLSVIALAAALASPIEVLSETLLAAHMSQHGLLIAVAPPLLVFAKPGVVFMWALPPGSRKRLAGSAAWRLWAALGRAFSRPLPAATTHGLALWIWHTPAAFNAAASMYPVHVLEHACFFGSALLLWRAILGVRSLRRAGAALAAAFATLVHGGLLGALITLAPVALYARYAEASGVWDLNAIEDQQLAGLVMWVPLGVVYLGACLMLASRLVASKEQLPMPADGLRGRAVLP